MCKVQNVSLQVFSYASSSTHYPCDLVSRIFKLRSFEACRLVFAQFIQMSPRVTPFIWQLVYMPWIISLIIGHCANLVKFVCLLFLYKKAQHHNYMHTSPAKIAFRQMWRCICVHTFSDAMLVRTQPSYIWISWLCRMCVFLITHCIICFLLRHIFAYLIFVIFFTQPQFEVWKFNT